MDEVDHSMPFFLFSLFVFASRIPGPVRPSVYGFFYDQMDDRVVSYFLFFFSRNRALVVNNGRKGYKRGDVSVFRCMGRCHARPLHGRHDWIARAGLY